MIGVCQLSITHGTLWGWLSVLIKILSQLILKYARRVSANWELSGKFSSSRVS